jgi:hypothetical protein
MGTLGPVATLKKDPPLSAHPLGQHLMDMVVSAASLLFLALLGAIGAKAAGAPIGKARWRI